MIPEPRTIRRIRDTAEYQHENQELIRAWDGLVKDYELLTIKLANAEARLACIYNSSTRTLEWLERERGNQ